MKSRNRIDGYHDISSHDYEGGLVKSKNLGEGTWLFPIKELHLRRLQLTQCHLPHKKSSADVATLKR
jgi:hypothetical protein